MDELLPCPFCGGMAKLKDVSMYTRNAKRVACTICGVRTKDIPIHFPNILGHEDFSVEEAEAIVVDIWNTRTQKERGGEK